MCQDTGAGGIVSEDELAQLTDLFRQFGSSEKLVSPTPRLMRGWFPPTVNPEGIASSSPGLRATSYPGKSCKPRLNPNGRDLGG